MSIYIGSEPRLTVTLTDYSAGCVYVQRYYYIDKKLSEARSAQDKFINKNINTILKNREKGLKYIRLILNIFIPL